MSLTTVNLAVRCNTDKEMTLNSGPHDSQSSQPDYRLFCPLNPGFYSELLKRISFNNVKLAVIPIIDRTRARAAVIV